MGYEILPDGKSIKFGSETIPVSGKCDVIVCGGGTAGLAAAVASARNGADTILIERNGFLGGVATATMMAVAWGFYDGMSGICKEIFQELVEKGYATPGPIVPFDHEGFKEVAFRLVEESGVRSLFYTMIVDTIVDNNQIIGVIVENKSGRHAILCGMVVDSTGDGDASARSGAEFIKGRTSDGKMRPVTLLFRMGNVDPDRIIEWAKANPQQFLQEENVNMIRPEIGLIRLHGFYSLVEQARANGELPDEVHYLRFEYVHLQQKTILVNTVRVYGVDGTNGWEVSKGELAARKQLRQVEQFIRKYVPGCENAFLLDTSSMLGVRETRHVIGDYIMKDTDVYEDPIQPESIFRNATAMPKYTEVHSADGKEGAVSDSGNRNKNWERVEYNIPYKSIVVKGFDNLYVAGRCMSSYTEADRLTRHIPVCLGTGQAAGTAAALALKHGKTVRSLDIELLQQTLESQGVDIGRHRMSV